MTSADSGAASSRRRVMQAITARDRAAGTAGLSLAELPYPEAAENDVVVRVHAAGFTPGELDWPGTWLDHGGRDRTPTVPGHEVSGVVEELGSGTTGLSVGQRVFGLAAWRRNGSLAEYVAVEARNLAPLPADIEHTVATAVSISGLTAWQGLFTHGRLEAGQTVLITGAAGSVGSLAVQLAREAGARVIGAGRGSQSETVLGLGADRFVDLDTGGLDRVGEIDLLFDTVGGESRERGVGLVRAGGTLVTITTPPDARPRDGRAIFFIVEADRGQLEALAQRVRDRRLEPTVGAVRTLAQAVAAIAPGRSAPGKTVVLVTAD
jgi:NADPH:quinone reductase-like Zn-dependent oxidoreductase